MRVRDTRRMERNLPPSPNMPNFPMANIAVDSLAARNAMGQGLVAAGPRPAPPEKPHQKAINIPQSKRLSLEEIAGGKGVGQGVVPNSPMPAPAEIKIPTFSVQDWQDRDTNLANFTLRGQGITPQAQYNRPSHTLEIYGAGREIDVSGLDKLRSEEILGPIMNHGVTESFGGDPRFEANRTAIRPRNPNQFINAPTVNLTNLKSESRHVPVLSKPVLPAPTTPQRPNIGHLIGPAKKVTLEAQYVAPPIRNADLGGVLSSTSAISGNIGVSPGRAFGAEAHLFR